MQHDGNKIAILQQQNSERTKLLTVITLVITLVSYTERLSKSCTEANTRNQIFLPISISSGLFSIDGDMLPFDKSVRNYLLLTLCLATIALAISLPFLNRIWWLNALSFLRRIRGSAVQRREGDEEILLESAAPMARSASYHDDEIEMYNMTG